VARQVLLLRGINIGSANRIAMPALRAALAEAGFGEVRTYMQSGNIVLESEREPAEVLDSVSRVLLERFRLVIQVVVRTADELVEVVARNPFDEEAAINPKALQVTFRGDEVQPDAIAALQDRAAPSEKVAAVGREIYSWHPDGIARSKLAVAITPRNCVATARNWKTVTTLLEMATDAA
jgi:uncharacterized protein (DUF1697 family)